MPDPLPIEEEQPLAPPANEEEDGPAPELPDTAVEFRAFASAVRLMRRKTQLANELKEVEDELKGLQPLVFSYFAQHSIKQIRIAGVTLYLRRELWARPKTPGSALEVCAAMRATGFGHFVHDTYNSSSFSAHIREIERQHAAAINSGEAADVGAFLPPALARVLNVTPSFKLMGRFSDK